VFCETRLWRGRGGRWCPAQLGVHLFQVLPVVWIFRLQAGQFLEQVAGLRMVALIDIGVCKLFVHLRDL
jgi:hypothetical protein